MNEDEVVPRFEAAVRSGELALPRPGSGATTERFDALWRLGREDLSLARLAEAHTDAIAILDEAACPPPPGHRGLGVWAAEGPGSTLELQDSAAGLRLRGTKRWCSGAPLVSHALVTCGRGDERLLVLVPIEHPGVQVHDDGWASPAFRVTATQRVEFDLELPPDAVVGPPGFYLDRPGFWYGAIGVAACWAGGAAAIVDAVRTGAKEPHGHATVGAASASSFAMVAALRAAAAEIDGGGLAADPPGRQALALAVRHVVDVGATEIVRLATRALGPGPMAHDAGLARRLGELQLYLRQSHAERDLEVLGRLPDPVDLTTAPRPRQGPRPPASHGVPPGASPAGTSRSGD